MGIYIEEDRADEFVAHLQSLPVDEAIALAKDAVRGANRAHNSRVLFRAKSMAAWLVREEIGRAHV